MKTITLGQLLREKDSWYFAGQNNKYQTYMSADFKHSVKIKRSIVVRYLDNELENCPAGYIPCKNGIALAIATDKL